MNRLVFLFVVGIVSISGVFGGGEFETLNIAIKKANSNDTVIQSIGLKLHENFGNAKGLISLEKKDADNIQYCLFLRPQ